MCAFVCLFACLPSYETERDKESTDNGMDCVLVCVVRAHCVYGSMKMDTKTGCILD